LNPKNAGYHSNLGYSYYQNCLELSHPGGRRDGIITEDAEKAILNMDNALNIDPARITDLYRKGHILTSVLPPIILFGNRKDSEKNYREIRGKINEGIKCFHRVEEAYEVIPEIDKKSLQRYFKEYIKALYSLAYAYCANVIAKWKYEDYFNFLPESGGEMHTLTKFSVTETYTNDLNNINKALAYLEKCVYKDNKEVAKMKNPPDVKFIAERDGYVDGVYKLYSAGKYYFRKYIIYKKNGEDKTAEEFAHNAEKLFKSALRMKYPENKSRLSKGFISEKLARLYISKGFYSEAVKTLERVAEKYCDYYIRYTYALALHKTNENQKAIEQIKLSLQNKKANKDIKLGEKMLGVFAAEDHNTNLAV